MESLTTGYIPIWGCSEWAPALAFHDLRARRQTRHPWECTVSLGEVWMFWYLNPRLKDDSRADVRTVTCLSLREAPDAICSGEEHVFCARRPVMVFEAA